VGFNIKEDDKFH